MADSPVRARIAASIRAGGPISFADFMALALYDAEHGYYHRVDHARDYQTSPDLHPVFGATVGRQVAEMWQHLGRPGRFSVFEDGAGSGRLAASLLDWAAAEAPDFYAALRYEARDLADGRLDDGIAALDRHAGKLTRRDGWPEAIEGCILTNELLDAFPVHRVRVEDGRLLELRVGLDGDRFVDVASPASGALLAYFEALGLQPGEGCDAEVNLEAPRWVEMAARHLRRGYVLTFDYGYEAADLYAPWRKRGTLLTFHRHTSDDDPYARVGDQDITASIDFTTVRQAGEAAGLRTLGLVSQAAFLANLGIGEALTRRPDPNALEAHYALRRAIVELTDAAGLGRISVLVQGRDVPDLPLTGLRPPEV
jgi:SAM-dependent MidA family methyltransferase